MLEHLENEILASIKVALERMILGKENVLIQETPENQELKEIVELINILSQNMAEMNDFARGLAKGNLDVAIPGRRNYIASTLKELHSQLSSFVWIVRQLNMGKIVDRLDYMGELSESLNGLIDIIANYYNKTDVPDEQRVMDFEAPISSWQYHQVYLAFNHLSMMIMEIDENDKVIFSNKAAKTFFGDIDNLDEGLKNPKVSYFADTLATLSSESNTFPSYNEIYDEGSQSWYRVSSDQIQFPNRQKVYIHTMEDISHDKAAVKELEKSAKTDYLTNVYNRSVGVAALEEILKNKEDAEQKDCAAFIDLDGLKQINDNYGHVEGDYAIKTISEVLTSSVRGTDIVSRFGGDEFLIVFHNCAIEVAEKVLERMYSKLDKINETNDKPFELSFSHGMVQITPGNYFDVKELILLMDKKMYERKRQKKVMRRQEKQ